MCSILCWILSIWEVEFLAFLSWFMHCQQGGEVWAWNGLLHAFRRFSSGFELFLSSGSCPGGIGLTGEGHRSDRRISQVLGDLVHRSDRWGWPVWPVRAMLMQLLCFMRWFACIHPGGVALIQGQLACVQGELFVVFKLWFGGLCSLLEHSFVSDVSSRCPCLGGPRLVFFRWSFYVPFFGFRSLVGVSFYLFLFFSFSLVLLHVSVLSMHSSRGRLRTMCGSRTGGWSLPCVMSDWQRCVDWFLAKYCRCRLRLDSCWCRWRTSPKPLLWVIKQ
jgi:hypothetical protein